MTAGFMLGAALAAGIWLYVAVTRRARSPYRGGPVEARQSSRTRASAVASAHVTVNVQTVDPAQLAAMASILASAAAAGHTTIPVPSARALEIEADKMLAIATRPPLPGAATSGTSYARQSHATGPGSHRPLRSMPGRSEPSAQGQ